MLKGLETVELKLSELENQFTIGAEFYKQEFTSIVDSIKLSSISYDSLANLTKQITDGDHGSTNYTESGILYLLSESIKDGYIDTSVGTRYISPEYNKSLKRSELKPGDIVLTKTGVYFGKSSVIPTSILKANTSAHVAKIVPTNAINPYYLSTYFNSKYGFSQLRRRGQKVSRPEIKLIEFQDILINVPSFKFQESVEHVILKSQSKLKDSKTTYRQAETLLLETLGLTDFEPSDDGVNVKSFKNSFLDSGRLDSEYYLKKYEEIVLKIKNHKFDKLTNLVNIHKSIEPGSKAYDEEEGLPFVRVADLSKHGISSPSINISDLYYNTNATKLNKLKIKKDTVLMSKDGSVGISYAVKEDLDMITSGAILHLHIKDEVELLPEYLSMVLNSQTTQLQAERDAGGSIILHWRVSEIEDVLIPLLSIEIQEEIQDLVVSSFELRTKSESLLEIAKRGVEIAIEQDEEVAMDWMKKELDKIGVEI